MTQERRKGWRMALALMCAAALMVSMGTPVGPAERAFAGDSGEADCAEALAVNDVAYGESAAAENGSGSLDDESAAGSDSDDGGTTGAEGADGVVGEEASDAEGSQEGCKTAGDAVHDSETSISDDCAMSAENVAGEVAGSGSEDGHTVALGEDGTGGVDDSRSAKIETPLTIYVGGEEAPVVLTAELLVPTDEPDNAHWVLWDFSSDDLPAPASTKTISLMGQSVTGEFRGWTLVDIVDGVPQWYGERRQGNLGFGSASAYFQSEHGDVNTPLAEYVGSSVIQPALGEFGSNARDIELALQPVYTVDMYKVELYPCTPWISEGSTRVEVHKEDAQSFFVPHGFQITPSLAEMQPAQAFGSSAFFMADSYQFAGWYQNGGWFEDGEHILLGSRLTEERPGALEAPYTVQRYFGVFTTGDLGFYDDVYGSGDSGDGDDADDSEGGGFTVGANGTGVSVEGRPAGPNAPEGSNAILYVNPVTEGDAYDKLVAAMGDGRLAGVFEINLHIDGIRIHDGFGSLEVSFPIEGADGHWVTVYHLHEDGSITSERAVAANGKVTVTVMDLSTFALEVGERYIATDTVTSPATKADGGVSDAGIAKTTTSARSGAALAQTGDEAPGALVIATALASAVALVLAAGVGRRAWGRHR